MSKPRLLDLFCCQGGAARGYQNAGFHVTGVDMEGKYGKRYAGDEFHQGDAIEFVKEHGHEFDVIHASPPCQAYSVTRHGHDREHPKLIEPTRDALVASGKPYVIENVKGAPLLNPTVLCGSMFGLEAVDDDGELLRLERHRLFETSFHLPAPGPDVHDRTVRVGGAYGGARKDKWEAQFIRKGGYVPPKHVQEQLLGIDWMTLYGLWQSIPPVYSEWVGKWIMEEIR